MEPSGPGLSFVGGFEITDCISPLVISLVKSCVFPGLIFLVDCYVSRNLFVSSVQSLSCV